MLEIIDVDFNNPEHGRQVLAMLDEYASGPMGGNTPLPAHVHRDLIPELARRPTARALLARVDGEPAGVAIYLEGFSTFACRPLLNLHDLGVSPRFQGQGVGKALLSALEQRGRAMGCCKITLEVLEGNAVAQGLYRKQGYEGYALDEHTGRALFWQKKLAVNPHFATTTARPRGRIDHEDEQHPFGTTDWNEVERTEHPGETGVAYWRTRQFDNVRVRMVEYSPATWRTTGAARAISSSAWTASCTPSWRMAAASC